MLRTVLGVVLGYVGMFIVIFGTLSVAYVAMGTEGAFQPGSFRPTLPWLVVTFAVSIGAAMVGGAVAAWIGRTRNALLGLIGVIVVLGALNFAMEFSKPDPGVRDDSLGSMEAMQQARQPLWASGLMPLIGGVGAWMGGAVALGRQRD